MNKIILNTSLFLFIFVCCFNKITYPSISITNKKKKETRLSPDTYLYKINLTKCYDDKIHVTLIPPNIKSKEIIFCFPSIVPGAYVKNNFGQFISDLKIEGLKGELIKTEKLDENRYKLSPANKIARISYRVDDTFDDTTHQGVFEPVGSIFESGKIFLINTHCVFGYFEGISDKYFNLEIEKPVGFYPSVGGGQIKIGKTSDKLSFKGYNKLADMPIMYCVPDTASIKIDESEILISIYSPNKRINPKFVAKTLKPLLTVQKNYLGGKLPVNKYSFLFYFSDKPTRSKSYGALEHSYSSTYVLPETDTTKAGSTLRHTAAHEFFHIVTPLNIHSDVIEKFNFIDPKMCKHLWLYEGLTEYITHHSQLVGGLITRDEFFSVISEKIKISRDNFIDTLPFTKISKEVLDIHSNQYNNVYFKGALINLCLDLILIKQSKGKYNVTKLLHELSIKYGPTKSFKEEELLNEIEKLTYKEVGNYFKQYVEGNKPLPLESILAFAGLKLAKKDFDYYIQIDENSGDIEKAILNTWVKGIH